MQDPFHLRDDFKLSEIQHKYGDGVHILSDPFLFTQLARISTGDAYQPMINGIIRGLYRDLLRAVVCAEFPRKIRSVKTRMFENSEKAVLEYNAIDPECHVVTVDIARAGILPSQTCFDVLNNVLNPRVVRQDHLVVSRMVDCNDQVTGASISGCKIGGPIEDRILLFPDPMGATGSSLSAAISSYKKDVLGIPMKWITLNLIVTPEFIRRIKQDHPEVIIYALRLDRGLSSPAALAEIPGTLWDEECGLNDHQYIIPGAGGLGEIMNNSYI